MQDSLTCSLHHENNIDKRSDDKISNACTASQTKNNDVSDTSARGYIGADASRTDDMLCPTINNDKMAYCLVNEYYTLRDP